MQEAVEVLDFELAAQIRDMMLEENSYPAVNIYILISGYVGLYSNVGYKEMFGFWV